MSDDSLQAEVERLRAEVEAHRQRELADLRAALTAAREEAAYYRAQAYDNAETGRKIYATGQEEISRLRAQLESHRMIDANKVRHAHN